MIKKSIDLEMSENKLEWNQVKSLIINQDFKTLVFEECHVYLEELLEILNNMNYFQSEITFKKCYFSSEDNPLKKTVDKFEVYLRSSKVGCEFFTDDIADGLHTMLYDYVERNNFNEIIKAKFEKFKNITFDDNVFELNNDDFEI